MIKRIILAAFFLLVSHPNYAGHVTGGEITYIYVSPNTYEVTLRIYHDCSGIALPNTADICFSSISCGMDFTFPLYQVNSQQLLQPACTLPGTSSCQGGNMPGIEEVIYRDTITLTGACPDWLMSYSSCCTTSMLTTVSNVFSTYIEARLNNVLDPTGSSPQFQHAALPWFCLNQFSMYDFNCVDPDGDGLQYIFEGSLDESLSCPANTTPVNYTIPYSPSNPLSSSSTITLNSSTGLMTFTPNQLLTAIIKVRVNALGGGGITGSVMRQNIVTIYNGITGLGNVYDKNFSASFSPTVSDRYFDYTINARDEKPTVLKIFNALGEVVYSAMSLNSGEKYTLDFGSYPAGIYNACFINGIERHTEKIIKL